MVFFIFKIGQIVERVRGEKEHDYIASFIRQFTQDDSIFKHQDVDLFRVREWRVKRGQDYVEHDLYLCQNLKTLEFTLFGRSELRDHVEQ